MANIILISAVFTPEPVVSAKLSNDLAIELSKSNNVTVLAPRPTRPYGFKFSSDKQKSKNYKLINLSSFTCPESNIFGRLRESYSFGMECRKYIKSNHKDIDVIYMNSWPIFAQYITTKIARKKKIPLITHVQDVYPESLVNKVPKLSGILNMILLPLDKYTLRNSGYVIAISDKMKSYLSKTRNVESDKIRVVKNWQNETSFVEASLKEDIKRQDKFTFMYLGNIGPVAGVDLLIDAFVSSKLEKARLLIAGSGSKRKELEDKVKKLKVNNVKFIDVPNGKVPETQEMADVMLLPIKKGAASSSIPSKLPAYMFSKKPIIGSVDTDSDTAKVIIDSKCGWVIKPEDEKLLSLVMKETFEIDSKDLLNKGELGFNYALEYLSKKHNLPRVVEVINKSL